MGTKVYKLGRKKEVIVSSNLFALFMILLLLIQIVIQTQEKKNAANKTSLVLLNQISMLTKNSSNEVYSVIKSLPTYKGTSFFVADKDVQLIFVVSDTGLVITDFDELKINRLKTGFNEPQFFTERVLGRKSYCVYKEMDNYWIGVTQAVAEVNKTMWENIVFMFLYICFALAMLYLIEKKLNASLHSEEKLKDISNTDEMTGLYNRRLYEKDINEYNYKYPEDNFVLVAADINGLKTANDNLGHAAGDELIVGTARCLKDAFSPFGKVYRTGGDEFIALIHTTKDMEEIVKHLRDLTECWHGKHVDSLSISIGYATKKEFEDPNILTISQQADKRMYADKAEFYKKNGIERRKN